MALELPSWLADVLEGLGYHWTNTDENALSDMGNTWVNFAGKPQEHAATANGHAQSVIAANQGQGIDAMNAAWSQNDAAHKNLTDGGTAAALIGAGVHICAGVVLVLKVSVIIQLVQLVIGIAAAIAAAVVTAGTSLLEVAALKEFAQKALGLIQTTVINTIMVSA